MHLEEVSTMKIVRLRDNQETCGKTTHRHGETTTLIGQDPNKTTMQHKHGKITMATRSVPKETIKPNNHNHGITTRQCQASITGKTICQECGRQTLTMMVISKVKATRDIQIPSTGVKPMEDGIHPTLTAEVLHGDPITHRAITHNNRELQGRHRMNLYLVIM